MKEGRLPYIKPAEMDTELRAFYDDVVTRMGNPDAPFIWRLEEGQLNGPFNSMLRYPKLGQPLYELQRRVVKQNLLPARVFEITALTTVCASKTAYGMYAHRKIAAGLALGEANIAALENGEIPSGLSTEERTAAELAAALNKPGVVPEAIYKNATETFGEEGYMVLVHTVAFFKYIATLMNAFDEPAPE